MLLVRLPCGTRQQISGKTVYGRGNPPNLCDPLLSRQQVELCPVDGMHGVLQLTNTGLNAIIVESQQQPVSSSGEAAGAGAADTDAAAGAQWQVCELLDQGDSTCVGPNTRFYLASRQDTTTFTLISSGADSTGAAGNAGSSRQQQQQLLQDTQAMSRADQEAADAALAAALAAEEEEQQQQGQEQEQQRRRGSSEGDDDDDDGEEGGEGDMEDDWAAAGVAAAAPARDAAADRPAKRRRHERETAAGSTPAEAPQAAAGASAPQIATAVGGGSTAAGAGVADGTNAPPAIGESPFSLLAVRGLPAASNAGCLGVSLKRLVVGQLGLCLVSNYMVDGPWLISAFPALAAADKVICVHGEPGDVAANISTAAAAVGLVPPRFAAHKPPLPLQFGTHHSKAFVLGYKAGGVRVIIHTANMIYPDCNDKSQGLWYQDFPPKTQDSPNCSEFESSLADYLACLKLPGSWGAELGRLVAGADFSSARVALIASVPGYHTGPLKLHAYGHMRLRALLAASQLPARFRAAPCVIQCSSLGSLDEAWLRQEFLGSLTAGRVVNDNTAAGGGGTGQGAGSSSSRSMQTTLTTAGQGGLAVQQQGGSRGVCPGPTAGIPLHIVWPTVSEVQHSREGWAGGYSIPGPTRNVTKPFLQQHWCRWGGEPAGRESAMPHIKTYTRFLPAAAVPEASNQPSSSSSSSSGQGAELAWWLCTSHNLSKAAWGSLQKGGSQLMIRSYELGVLGTPALEAAYRAHPHRFYSCTGDGTAAVGASAGQPTGGSTADASVRFYAWSKQQQQQQGLPSAAAADAGTSAAAAHAAGGSSSSSSDAAASPVLLPLPYRLPPQRYGNDDSPWCSDVLFSGLDCFGNGCRQAPFRGYGNIEPSS